jgi:hypothetical protein
MRRHAAGTQITEGESRQGCRRQRLPGFAKQTHSPKLPRRAILGSARDRSGNTGSPTPLSAREACRLRTHAARRSASICRCPGKKRRGCSRAGARLRAEELERIARSGACAGCAHLRMEMMYNPFLTAQPRMGLMRPNGDDAPQIPPGLPFPPPCSGFFEILV